MYPGTTQQNPYFQDAAPLAGEKGGSQQPTPGQQRAGQQQWTQGYGAYYPPVPPIGPKPPVPAGRPSRGLFMIGALGCLVAGLIFLFWGVLSFVMFPILTIMQFEGGSQSVIYINMILHILLCACMIPIMMGFIGFYRNYGSKFVLGQIISGVALMLTMLISALFLGAAAEAAAQYAVSGHSEYYYYSRYDNWDRYYYILHFAVENLSLATGIIFMSIPFMLWKRANRYPMLAQACGILGIVSGSLILIGLAELIGIGYFTAGAAFVLMAAGMLNFMTMTEEEWRAYFALKAQIDAQGQVKDKAAMQIRYQMMYDPNIAFNPIYASMLAGGNPYQDLEKNIEKARSDG
jgi:hypothetical protein